MLDAVDKEVRTSLSAQLSCAIDKLLLTNIALNYEDVYYTVKTYDLLNPDSSGALSQDKLALLAQRIQSALDAELCDVPM